MIGRIRTTHLRMPSITLSLSQDCQAINSREFLSHVYTLSCSASMQVASILSIALVFIWSALEVSCFSGPAPCKKPAVRREWRAFSAYEKAEWIRAVNVRVSTYLASAHFEAVLVSVPVSPAS